MIPFLLLFSLLIIVSLLVYGLSDSNILFVEYETVGDSYGKTGDYIIKVIHQPCRLERLLGSKGVIAKYIGSSTVWYNMSTERRAGTSMESWLSDKYTFIKYEEQGLLKGAKK